MKGKLFILLFLVPLCSLAQNTATVIREEISTKEIETHIRFLASDALMGREAGTPEIDIAAAYIASYLQSVGVKKLPGMDSYLQQVPLYSTMQTTGGDILIGNQKLNFTSDVATDFNAPVDLSAPAVFIEYGLQEDIEKSKINGKIAVVLAGEPGGSFQEALSVESLNQKLTRLKEAGAVGAVILWHYNTIPWPRLQGWLQRETMSAEKPENQALPYFFIDATSDEKLKNLKSAGNKTATLKYSGREIKEMVSYNVLGYVEGSVESDKYLLLGAHYDHEGGEKSNDGQDRIFNGARDNAVGTAAIMMAGDYFADHQPKTSIILAAWTAEEKGLIGSRYFAENPPVDLNKIIFNLNIDNAGYNDTTIVTVVGLDRTQAQNAIASASEEFGLKAVSDPAPEQNLFDRSDNVNFARKGIPSPTFSLGFTAFDKEIQKYYHQVEDEVETLNFNYITKYTRAFVYAAQKIADQETETFWIGGDKYEEAGKTLYKK